MSEAAQRDRGRRRQRLLLAGLGLALALLLASCPIGMVLVKQRIVRPPAFAFQIGETEIAAPCPTRGFICTITTSSRAMARTLLFRGRELSCNPAIAGKAIRRWSIRCRRDGAGASRNAAAG